MLGPQDLATFGQYVFMAIGIAALIAINFACYYFPTQYAVKRAGREKLPIGAMVRGFIGMALCGTMVAIGLSILFRAA